MKNRIFTVLSVLGIFVISALSACSTETSGAAGEGNESTNSDYSSQSSQAATGGTEVRRESLRLIEVKNQDKTVWTAVSGRVVPRNTTQVFAEVQGRILSGSRTFKEGETFKKGEVLLQLDAREFALNLESQRSAFLNILTGMMPDLKADYADNYQQWLGYVQAYDSGEPLQPLPKTASEGEKYFITANQVFNTYYTIKSQEERLRKYVIRAPYAGMLTTTQVDVGGLVSPGQILGTIISHEQYELEAGANLAVANALSVGDQLTFRSNEVAGEWTGEVVRINGIVDPRTQNIPVFFRVKGPRLRSGMYLEGQFATQRYEDVFVIPEAALARDESVLVLDQDVIARKPIEPLEYLRDSIVVRGLAEQDQLIVNQFDMPVEGKRVKM